MLEGARDLSTTSGPDDEASNMPAMQTPDWLDVNEYPFRSRFLGTPHGDMHYVDEGSGEVILFLHGNPTWSFMYRSLIKGLSQRFRCVAPDHIGFGLSDKPFDVSYLPQFHAANLERFVEALGLKDITLVIHDWGGSIGMSYALDHPDNVKRLIVFNTWFWSVEGNKAAANFSRIVGGPIGRFACRYLNAFPRFVMPSAVGNKAKFGKLAHRHYIKPFPTSKSRKGTWVFPKAIIGQSDWLASLWAKRERLSAKPIQLLWGLKDPGFGKRELERWQGAFPRHETLVFPEVGHFVAEELGADAVDPVEAFLEKGR
jgi:pimeloyl-ACP methyl ester carboxylesterase